MLNNLNNNVFSNRVKKLSKTNDKIPLSLTSQYRWPSVFLDNDFRPDTMDNGYNISNTNILGPTAAPLLREDSWLRLPRKITNLT